VFIEEQFGGEPIVTATDVYRLEQLTCLKAVLENETAGFACYLRIGDVCEIVILGSLIEGKGIGTALVSAVLGKAGELTCTHLRAYTTNDNESALRFYQKQGFAVVATHRNVMDKVRRYKPQLPVIGLNGLPLCDMIELQLPVPVGSLLT
jgi:GNAT superfamily N-acetyltransferase